MASPVVGASSLPVVVHGCPVGIEGASAAELAGACTGHPVSGLYVSDLPGFHASGSTTGIAGDNGVTFEDVPASDLDLMYLYPWPLATNGTWCHVASDALDSSGRWIDVEPGGVTTVALYSRIALDA